MEKSFLNNITWKKIMWFWIILTCTTLFIIYAILNRDPSKLLLNHLKSKYNKEFVIVYDGERSDGISSWYEAEIYPKEFIGTAREYDKYYWAKGFVEAGEVGDTYGQVLLKESANKFYLSKLEELFGKNVLPVIEIDDKFCKFTDFEKELEDLKKINAPMPISGGIYIFGRVENDEDREKYREEIYKFLSFMKETGTFEYVSLGINIADERCLTDYFKKNIENLLKAKEKYKTSSEFIAYRDKIFKEAEKEFEQMPKEEKQKRISEFNKSSLLESDIDGYGVIYHAGILSPKFKDSEPRAQSKRKEYNDIKDVELLNTMKILYMEYYRKEDGEIVEK